MSKNIWKNKTGETVRMDQMSEQELQEALIFAEKYHVYAENTIQKALKNSKIFRDKAVELKRIAKERNIDVKSLFELYPGKYTFLENTYKLLEA